MCAVNDDYQPGIFIRRIQLMEDCFSRVAAGQKALRSKSLARYPMSLHGRCVRIRVFSNAYSRHVSANRSVLRRNAARKYTSSHPERAQIP